MARDNQDNLPLESATLPPQPSKRHKARTVLEQLDDLAHLPFVPRRIRRP